MLDITLMKSGSYSIRQLTLICLLVYGLVAIKCSCQSVNWAVPPTLYTDINQIGCKLFQATGADRNSAIIDASGRVLVNATCDNITPFYKGWALLLDGSQIVGCIKDDGTCHIFKEKGFQVIKQQEFVTEGLITVKRKDGKPVYVDTQGNEIFGGNQNYYHIMPFSEGYAVVFKGPKNSCHIDKSGREINPEVKAGVKLTHATNFYNGVAYVWDDNGNYFEFDGSRCKETKMPHGKPDFLFRLSGEGNSVPYDAAVKREELPNVTISEVAGRYGYNYDNKTLLPCQFTSASLFYDQYAIVKMDNGKCGILHYCPESEGSFGISVLSSLPIQYERNNEPVACQFKISSMPSQWQKDEQGVNVSVDDNLVRDLGDGVYEFDFMPFPECDGNFRVSIKSQGLLLYEDIIHYDFVKKAKEVIIPVQKETPQEVSQPAAEEKPKTKSSKPKTSETKKAETKKAETKKTESKKAETKKTETVKKNQDKQSKQEDKTIKQRKRR